MSESVKSVCVMGLGYIGLPTASFLATKNHRVLGVDVRPDVVDTINRGELHISEPDLDVLVRSAVNSGNLKAALEPAPADVFIIAVPTPFKNGHVPDLSSVEKATAMIAPHLRNGNIVILESTSPVGTTEAIARQVQELRPDLRISGPDAVRFAHCPERVLPGQILRELVENDRVVGGIDPESTEAVQAFYAGFVAGKILKTDARTAELTKLTENAYRDVNIAFANELSLICKDLSIDPWELIGLANHHPRVNILQPGPGVGGHCIAVDPWFIVHSAPGATPLIRTARERNVAKTQAVLDEVLCLAKQRPSARIACLGLTYKPNVDDTRESPALWVAEQIAAREDCRLIAVDPYLHGLPQGLAGRNNVQKMDAAEAIEQADIIVALVPHDEFGAIDRARLSGKMVVDTCGLWRGL